MNKNGESKQSIRSHEAIFEHLFKQLHASLFFYALKFVGTKEIAKDLVQDTFLDFINSKELQNIDNLKGYLFRMVRNNCLNYLKHNEIRTKYLEQEQKRAIREIKYYDLHQTLVEKELQEKITDAIENLPEHYKEPFKLSRFEDLKNKEIAEKLNIPLRTVETRIYRALKILKEKLSGSIITLFHHFYS